MQRVGILARFVALAWPETAHVSQGTAQLFTISCLNNASLAADTGLLPRYCMPNRSRVLLIQTLLSSSPLALNGHQMANTEDLYGNSSRRQLQLARERICTRSRGTTPCDEFHASHHTCRRRDACIHGQAWPAYHNSCGKLPG
jgi:hypothetical protein